MKGNIIVINTSGVRLQNLRTGIEYHPTQKVCANKKCVHNGVAQPIENFTRATQTNDGKSVTCRDCQQIVRDARKRKKLEDNFIKFF